MSLANYFENVKGVGVLGTADPEGKVDLALYARPHVIDEETVAFIMRDRLSHSANRPAVFSRAWPSDVRQSGLATRGHYSQLLDLGKRGRLSVQGQQCLTIRGDVRHICPARTPWESPIACTRHAIRLYLSVSPSSYKFRSLLRARRALIIRIVSCSSVCATTDSRPRAETPKVIYRSSVTE
jgi:hypothetical protein